MSRATLIRVVLGLALVGSWGVGTADAERSGRAATRRVTTEELGGGERYLVYVSTDKPIYREGESVYVRGVVLDASTHKPRPGGYASPMVEILGPKEDTVASGYAQAADSVAGFGWTVPEGAAGGEYKVKLSFPGDGFPPAERKFEVRAYRPPRLKSQIVFVREGYGPGDTVSATLHTERAEGGIPRAAKISVTARVDGSEVFQGKAGLDATGNASVSFSLPAAIERGEGTLAFVIEDGGVVETASKTIPILVVTLDLGFFPEGGDLVAGLPNRLYVEAKTPNQKPADLEGVIVDGKGAVVAELETEHEGRGRVTFTPQAGQSYALQIRRPSGIAKRFPLPKVKEEGAVLSAIEDRTPHGKPVRLNVGSTFAGKVTVSLSQRENEVASTKIEFAKKSFWHRGYVVGALAEVPLSVPAAVDGVLVATVWDDKGAPLAERLVFVEPASALQVKVTPEKPRYATGDTVKLTVETRDAKGKPVGALVGVTVTDDAVLEMIEKREQAPRLPAMVFFENEVEELADAQIYLDPTNPKSPLAVDLLLGTQGWRRFALVDVESFVAAHGDAARRALAMRMVSPQEEERVMLDEAIPMAAAAPDDIPMAPRRPMAVRAAPSPAPRAVHAAPPPKMKAAEQPRDLRQAMGKAEVRADEDRLFARKRAMASEAQASAMAWAREYAHAARPDRKPGDRVDFSETLLWTTATRTDATSGKATLSFALSDSVTTFRVFADGFTDGGAVGCGMGSVESIQPFYVEPKVPLQVTSGDVIELPVAVVNATGNNLKHVTLAARAAKGIAVKVAGQPLAGKADSRERRLVTLDTGGYVGKADLEVEGKAGALADKVTRPLEVKPLGFPIALAAGGMLDGKKNAVFAFEIPQTVVGGSLATSAIAYPTPLANLTQALERLIQEPCGCFEQTSSTTYPLVMAQQYFTSHTGVDPSLVERSRTLLQKGYDRLATFECKQKGYEWFGEDPGHEALTAFGLMEFTDMAAVYPVDRTMLANTRGWLLKQKDGRGGFTHARRALHTWLVDQDLHNGYITWTLLETGEKGLDAEAKAFVKAANASKDSYVAALGANVAALSGDAGAAKALSQRLVGKQTKEGFVDGAETTIVGSRGESLQIETTSLAALAWMRDPAFSGATEKAIRWLAKVCEGGRFGSTQATVLALRAIVTYDKARARPKGKGELSLVLDGKRVASAVRFGPETQGAIELPDFAGELRPGRHELRVAMAGGAAMPYGVTVRFNTVEPVSSPQARLFLQTELKDRTVVEGNPTEINVTVANLADKPVPTPVAIIGVPGGLEVRHDQLKELKKSGRIAAYEVLGREVVLYWRELEAKQTVSLPLSLIAAIPGTYTAPASRAYEYYGDEFKVWVGGSKVVITPRP